MCSHPWRTSGGSDDGAARCAAASHLGYLPAVRYVPALDGLRAVAVVAVVVFHADVGLAPGGFLGVSLFFTLSGFLITTLLLHEHDSSGAISLRSFYERRARRLLPAAYLCLALVLAAAAWWSVGQQRALPGDVVASVLHVANWHFALSSATYEELLGGEASPVAHFWSLAIEEQIYLVLPIVAVVALRRGRRHLAVVTGVLLVASVAATLLTDDRDLVYNGTHTRAAELLIGVLLAVALRARRTARPDTARVVHPGLRERLGWIPGAGAGAALLTLVLTTTIRDDWVYRGGLVGVALLSAVLLVAVADGRFPARVLEARPLVAVGRVSYGIYLFHWPVFVLLDADRTGLDGVALFAVRIAVTAALTIASYAVVEQPIRYRTLLPDPRGLVAAMGAAAAVVVLVAAVVVSPPPVTETERVLALGDQEVVRFDIASPSGLGAGWSAQTDREQVGAVPTETPQRPPSTAATVAPPVRVVVVGSDAQAAAWLSGDDAVAEVVDLTDPGCPINAVDRCAPLAERIDDRLIDHRPDLLVVAVGAAEEDVALAQNAEAIDDVVALDALATIHQRVMDDLIAVVDLATSAGAEVVLVSTLGTATATYPRIARVALERPELDRVITDERSLVARVAAAARSDGRLTDDEPRRLLVIGDSTSLSLAQALSDGSDGRLAVTWAGAIGCPFAPADAIRSSPDWPWRPLDCPAYPDKVAALVSDERPEAIVLMTGPLEQTEQRLPGDLDGRTATDPVFLAHRDQALDDLLAAVGPQLPVLVADLPQISVGTYATAEMLAPERLDALNAQIDEWVDRHEQIARFDYRRVLEAREAERGTIRSDGVHPDAVAFEELARDVLVDQLVEQLDEELDRRGDRPDTPRPAPTS